MKFYLMGVFLGSANDTLLYKDNTQSLTIIIHSFFTSKLERQRQPSAYCNLEIGEKLRLISKSNDEILHLYVFNDLSSCPSCDASIRNIESKIKGKNIKIIILMDGLSQEAAESIKKENNWKSTVIGDESGLYHSYYSITRKPALLALSSDGTAVAFGELNTDVFTESMSEFERLEKEKKSKDKYKNESFLKEVKRLKLRDGEKAIISNGRYVEVLYNESQNEYYMRNLRKPTLYLLNSDGTVTKKISTKNSSRLQGRYANTSLSWAEKDSILFMVTIQADFSKAMQYYNISSGELSERYLIEPNYHGKRSKVSSIIKYITTFDLIFTHYDQNYKYPRNYHLTDGDTTIILYDKEGQFVTGFGEGDQVYSNYKISTWFKELFATNSDNQLLTLQQLSNKIKVWDKDFRKVKEFDIDLGPEYRYIKADMSDSTGKKFYIEKAQLVSRTECLLNDNINDNILVCYSNEIYPDGETDLFSKERIIEKYLVLCDKNGNELYDQPLEANGSFMPFYYQDNMIYGTEVDDKNHLEIVIYELKK